MALTGRNRARNKDYNQHHENVKESSQEIITKHIEEHPAYIPTPWTPSGYVAFRLLLAARMCAALWSNISDCDESYNYWEPMHFLLNGYGFQTWEYSPAYAIRSYAYLWLYAWPLKLHMMFFPVNKILHFYMLRCLMALVCTLCETYFYRAVCRQFGANTGRLTIGALVFAAGMFNASTAFLPSSFAMMTSMLAIGGWFFGNIPVAVFFTALGALVGWPFTAALGIPIALDALLRRRQIRLFISWSLVALVVCLVPLVVVDSYYYGGLVVAPFNILMYNVFTDHGPNIYGVEPWSYYFINCFLNFNIIFVLALLSLPIVMLLNYFMGQPHRGIPFALSLLPMYVWIVIFFTRPHKEERFLFPMYPLICLLAAVLVDYLQKLYNMLFCKKKSVHYASTGLWLPMSVGVLYALGCISRICAIYYGYHAPLDVYGELHQRIVDNSNPTSSHIKSFNVCVGKEWYRFPSNFFLPDDRWRLQFIKSNFAGQLPKPYSRAPQATQIFPTHMNDANREEMSRYVNISSCHYLIDLDTPVEAEHEPRYSQDKDWQVLISVNFLDSPRSHKLFRAFYIPFVSSRYVSYVNYNILVATRFQSKLLKI